MTNRNQKNNPLTAQALKLIAVGIILIALIITCMITQDVQRSVFVALYYLVTVVGVFIRRQFDAQVEHFTGKKRSLSPNLDLTFTLIFAFAIHWLLFWG